MTKVYEYLKSNQAYYQKLKKYIIDDINGTDEAVSRESDLI